MNHEFNWLKINRRLKVFYFHGFIKALLSYPQLYKQVQGITLVTFGVFNNIIIFNKKRTAIKIAVLFLEI